MIGELPPEFVAACWKRGRRWIWAARIIGLSVWLLIITSILLGTWMYVLIGLATLIGPFLWSMIMVGMYTTRSGQISLAKKVVDMSKGRKP